MTMTGKRLLRPLLISLLLLTALCVSAAAKGTGGTALPTSGTFENGMTWELHSEKPDESDRTLTIQGTGSATEVLSLASYYEGKMLDFRCVSVRKGTPFTLSVFCPENAEIKLFCTNTSMKPLEEPQRQEFPKAPEQMYYPLTIIGPNGSMYEEQGLRIEDGRLAIQASDQNEDSALYVPEKSGWIYCGWLFTAEKDGVIEELGIHENVTPELFHALLPKIRDGWNITMDSAAVGKSEEPSVGRNDFDLHFFRDADALSFLLDVPAAYEGQDLDVFFLDQNGQQGYGGSVLAEDDYCKTIGGRVNSGSYNTVEVRTRTGENETVARFGLAKPLVFETGVRSLRPSGVSVELDGNSYDPYNSDVMRYIFSGTDETLAYFMEFTTDDPNRNPNRIAREGQSPISFGSNMNLTTATLYAMEFTDTDDAWTLRVSTSVTLDLPTLEDFEISNVRFEDSYLVWDAVASNVKFRVRFSPDGGETWPTGCGTSYKEVATYSFAEGTYNRVRISAEFNGEEAAVYEGKLSLTVTQDADKPAPKSVAFRKVLNEDGELEAYDMTVTGLTPNTAHIFKVADRPSGWNSASFWNVESDDSGTATARFGSLELVETGYYMIQEQTYNRITNGGKTCRTNFAFLGKPTKCFNRQENYEITNIRFDGPFLTWDPIDSDEDVKYSVLLSKDGGKTWSNNCGTSDNQVAIYSFPIQSTLEIYNHVRVSAALNGRDVARAEAALDFAIMKGNTKAAPDRVTFKEVLDKDGSLTGYEMTATGLTPHASHVFRLTNQPTNWNNSTFRHVFADEAGTATVRFGPSSIDFVQNGYYTIQEHLASDFVAGLYATRFVFLGEPRKCLDETADPSLWFEATESGRLYIESNIPFPDCDDPDVKVFFYSDNQQVAWDYGSYRGGDTLRYDISAMFAYRLGEPLTIDRTEMTLAVDGEELASVSLDSLLTVASPAGEEQVIRSIETEELANGRIRYTVSLENSVDSEASYALVFRGDDGNGRMSGLSVKNGSLTCDRSPDHFEGTGTFYVIKTVSSVDSQGNATQTPTPAGDGYRDPANSEDAEACPAVTSAFFTSRGTNLKIEWTPGEHAENHNLFYEVYLSPGSVNWIPLETTSETNCPLKPFIDLPANTYNRVKIVTRDRDGVLADSTFIGNLYLTVSETVEPYLPITLIITGETNEDGEKVCVASIYDAPAGANMMLGFRSNSQFGAHSCRSDSSGFLSDTYELKKPQRTEFLLWQVTGIYSDGTTASLDRTVYGEWTIPTIEDYSN